MTPSEKIALSASLLLLAGVVAFTWLPGMPGNAAGSTKQGVDRAASATGRRDAHEPSRRVVPATAEERRARLLAIMDIGSRMERRQALLDYVDALPPSLFPETMEVWAGPQTLDLDSDIRLLMDAWLKIDAPAAMAHTAEMDRSLRYRGVRTDWMLHEWASIDLQAAHAWMLEHVDKNRRDMILGGVLSTAAATFPAEAVKIVLSEKDADARRGGMRSLAESLASRPDMEAKALEAACPERDSLSREIEAARILALFGPDPGRALKMMEEKPESAELIDVGSLFLGSSSGALGRIAAEADAMSPGPLRDEVMGGALFRWMDKDPGAARAWLVDHPQSEAVMKRVYPR